MNIPPSGARLQASSRHPSVDLATLIEVLVHVVNHFADHGLALVPDADHPGKRQLIQFDSRKRLRICTSGVLRRLFAAKKFRSAFQVDGSEPGTGFIQDFAPPRLGEIVRLGGRLTEGNENRLPKLLDRLSDEINRALEGLCRHKRKIGHDVKFCKSRGQKPYQNQARESTYLCHQTLPSSSHFRQSMMEEETY